MSIVCRYWHIYLKIEVWVGACSVQFFVHSRKEGDLLTLKLQVPVVPVLVNVSLLLSLTVHPESISNNDMRSTLNFMLIITPKIR